MTQKALRKQQFGAYNFTVYLQSFSTKSFFHLILWTIIDRLHVFVHKY